MTKQLFNMMSNVRNCIQDFIENADKDKAMAVEELGVENILDRLVCLMESSAKNISDYLVRLILYLTAFAWFKFQSQIGKF